MATPAPSQDLRTARFGLHAITLALSVVTAVRAAVDGAPLWLAILCALAFLACYGAGGLRLARATSARSVVWVLVLTGVWIASLAVSAEFVWLLFPLILVGGHMLRAGWAIAYTALVIAIAVFAPLAHGGSLTTAAVIGSVIGGLFGLGIARGYTTLLRDAAERRRLIATLVQSQDEMAALQDELARSQRDAGATAERTRLSRDLHDTIAQDLSSIALLARSAAASADPATLEQIERLARSGLEDTRRIVHALAPSQLEDGAIVEAVRRIAEGFAADTGLAVTVEADPALPALGSAVDVALLRTAQSAIANVRRHAHATRLTITISDMGDSVRMDIADDGRGFDVRAWERGVGSSDSYGLAAMRARLRELGGGLDVESEPGGGTVLSAHVPIGGAT